MVDVNTTLPGTVYISFVGTTYSYDSSLLQIRFRTICNENSISQITLAAADLCDLDLEFIQCSGRTTNVQVSYDPSYTVDAPSMRLSAFYHEETGKVTVEVCLDADSHLGAGDFVLRFDPKLLTYSSSTKMFDPTFFNINDKKVGEGELRFSIISLTDITQAQTVLTVEFDALRGFREQTTDLEIVGIGLADSITAPITLNFVPTSVTIPLGYLYGDADGNREVSLRDVLLLRQYLANRDPNTGVSSVSLEMGADANGDEKITLQDVLLLRKYLANRDLNTGESDIILGP